MSASRRTDIPAFFSDWFVRRLREGYFVTVNPFNANAYVGYSLSPQDVDAIVFWTKNPKPLMRHLDEIDERGYHYYFQYTLNDYPRSLEPNLPPLQDRLAAFKTLSERVGSNRVIWRYDPIIISSETDEAFHIERLSEIARELKGSTTRIVISFADYYGKVAKRLAKLSRSESLRFRDIAMPEYRPELMRLAGEIAAIAHQAGLEVSTCSEVVDLTNLGISAGACIDPKLLHDLFGITGQRYPKDRNQRPECLCAESIDMGAYNTCRFGCTYCYAIQGINPGERALEKHNPSSPSLIGAPPEGTAIRGRRKQDSVEQLSMFRE